MCLTFSITEAILFARGNDYRRSVLRDLLAEIDAPELVFWTGVEFGQNFFEQTVLGQ